MAIVSKIAEVAQYIRHVEYDIKTNDIQFFCEEKYVDDELSEQWFRPINFFHRGYEPEKMKFHFYGEDFDPCELVRVINDPDLDNSYPKPIYADLYSIDPNKLFCIWTSMNGEIYVINDDVPVPTPRRIMIGSNRYDLDEVENKLRDRKGVLEIKGEQVWYDGASDGNLVIVYQPTRDEMEVLFSNNSNQKRELILIEDILLLQKKV